MEKYFTYLLLNYVHKTGRGGETRTRNPSLPKRVRYQLRYAPNMLYATSKILTLLQILATFLWTIVPQKLPLTQ